MGKTVLSVMENESGAVNEDRVKIMIDKITNQFNTDEISTAALRTKLGDPYGEFKWVPEEFLAQAGQISMLTTLGFPWLYVSARACLRCGPESMPLVGVGSWYTDTGHGVSSWLFAWPIAEQVKVGVPMASISDFLAKLSLPDMLAFVKKGFHMVLTNKRVVWVPYGYNVAIITLNSDMGNPMEETSAHSHILVMPMISDTMANRDLSPEVVKVLVDSAAGIRERGNAGQIWDKIGPVYESWLGNFLAGKEDEGDGSASQAKESATISVASRGE